MRTDIFVVFGWIWNLLTARSGNISLWLRNVWYVRPTALLSTAEESPFFQYWKRKCVPPPPGFPFVLISPDFNGSSYVESCFFLAQLWTQYLHLNYLYLWLQQLWFRHYVNDNDAQILFSTTPKHRLRGAIVSLDYDDDDDESLMLTSKVMPPGQECLANSCQSVLHFIPFSVSYTTYY